jgi:pyochelin synthetase
VTRELPDELPPALTDAVRRDLRDTLDVPDDVIDWLESLTRGLAGVLTEDIHSAELYANDRTPGVYARLFGPTYHVAVEAVRRLVDDWPEDRPLRVLEVGAGYGSLTRHLLPLLPADRSEYLFTDISTYFLAQAREAFADYPFLRCELFDLDKPPEMQGFDDHAADLVVAASVLHDTKRVRRSLRQMGSVLAPEGLVLIVEQTEFAPWFDLTMGLQQGFDGYEDTDLRDRHPLLGREEWQAELAAAGYADSMVLTRTGGPAAVGFDVLLARGPAERRRFAAEGLRDFVAERLPKHMVPAHVYALDELPLSPTGKVDRGALAKTHVRHPARGRPANPPRTDRQRKLIEIWREVLGLSDLDLSDDFLDAGGDSLLAARLVASIGTAFGVTVPVAAVLEYPTVETFDRYLDQLLSSDEHAVAVETS